MVSPYLTLKTENSLTITENTRKLFQVIYSEKNKDDKSGGDEIAKIKVSEVISKLAFYYEKIRNTVDYQEEHLFRKNAIERILKRHIVIEGIIKVSDSATIAKNLLIELIRAGYLPNNKIPENKIDEIGNIIEKFIKLRNNSLARIKPFSHLKQGDVQKITDDLQERTELTNWLLAIAASEIEENIGADKVKKIIVSNMYENLVNNIKLPENLQNEKKDLEIQVYLSIHRNFLKFDEDMMNAILFQYFNPKWKKPSDDDIAAIAQDIILLRNAINYQMNHFLAGQINKIVNHYNVFYTILSEVVNEDPVGVYKSLKQDIKAFPRRIKNICAKKYKQSKSKLWRAAIRSILYIFITKSIFVLILEAPVIKWFDEEINPLLLGINVTFPAFLLFLIVLFTKTPSDTNTQRIIQGIEEIVFKENKKQEPFTLRKPFKRGRFKNVIFGIVYIITFFVSFGLIIWGLDKLTFNWVSIIIFLFFLALVSFFGIRIRKRAREFIVIEQKENIFSFIIDFFYIPIIAVGKWLSEKFSKINVFVFILDFIIEAPFKIFVEITEEWTKYVKERKEEMV